MTDDKLILHFIYFSLINVFRKNIRINVLLKPFLIYEGLTTKSFGSIF